ncbi:MAG: tetratricopeptide repeat protein [Terriglobia bacterium]
MLRSSIVSIISHRISAWSGLTLLLLSSSLIALATREKETEPAQVTIHADREGCAVDVDAVAAGKTDAHGGFLLRDIDPTDHYLHVNCPGQPESTVFISPQPGESLDIRANPLTSGVPAPASALDAAEAKIQLRQLIKDAVQLRARGHFDEAVQHLREAAKMDPANSDLHRELGITFLLVKEWKRARVEMLEAIRHQPDDADAHNGLGYALEKLGHLDAAVNEYRLATRLDPDDSSYRQHYIDALSRTLAHPAEKKR